MKTFLLAICAIPVALFILSFAINMVLVAIEKILGEEDDEWPRDDEE